MDSTEIQLKNPPDVKELTRVQQSAHAVLEQARGLSIESADDYEIGGKIVQCCATMTRELEALLNPGIKAAYDFHRTLTANLKQYTQPLGDARGIAGNKMTVFRQAEEKKRRDAEAKLREAARKEEEERQLAQAEALEKAGYKEEAELVISRPVAAPVVHVASTVPKIEGQSIRKTWKAHVVDAALVPRQYMIPDMVALNGIARSLKERANIPGVEFKADETITQRSV